MSEIIYEQLELFPIEETSGLEKALERQHKLCSIPKVKSSIPKVRKKRKPRGKKHRSREEFQELVKECKNYIDKIIFCGKEWTKSVHWEVFKKETLKTKQNSCEICELKNKLTLHHIRYDNVAWETYEKDIMVLCDSCHFIFEKHRTSLNYPSLREKYGIILIERFFNADCITESLREVNYLMHRGRIGYSFPQDEEFDHYTTVVDVKRHFRSSPFCDGSRIVPNNIIW